MKVRLFPKQLILAIQQSNELTDGSNEFDFPDACRVEEPDGPRVLTFSDSPMKVFYGKLPCDLAPLQLRLLRYLSTHSMATFTDLRVAVWQREVEDNAIRTACYKLGVRLSDADFPIDLTTLRDRVIFELIG